MKHAFKHFEALSYTQKMTALIDLYGYSETDFETWNEAYQIFNNLTDKQKTIILNYNNRENK